MGIDSQAYVHCLHGLLLVLTHSTWNRLLVPGTRDLINVRVGYAQPVVQFPASAKNTLVERLLKDFLYV